MTNEKRNIVLDVYKGFAIILVVLGHVLQYRTREGTSGELFDFIYSFHMPLFMFLSGYIAYISIGDKCDISKLKSKTLTILLPFFSWWCVKKTGISEFLNVWYLFVLYFNYVFIVFSTQAAFLFNKKSTVFHVIFCFFLFVFLKVIWNILGFNLEYADLFFRFVPFFLIGYFFAKHRNRFKPYIKLIISICSPIFLFMLINYIWRMGFSFSYFNFPAWLDMPMRQVIGLMGIVSTYPAILMLIRNVYIANFLSWLGRYTLDIYVLHFFFIGIFSLEVIEVNSLLGIIKVILLSSIVLSLALLISHVFLRVNKIVSILFFGGR